MDLLSSLASSTGWTREVQGDPRRLLNDCQATEEATKAPTELSEIGPETWAVRAGLPSHNYQVTGGHEAEAETAHRAMPRWNDHYVDCRTP